MSDKVALESNEARDAREFAGGKRTLCSWCGHRVTRYTRADIAYIKRNGCGCPASPVAKQQRAYVLRDRRPLRDTGRRK